MIYLGAKDELILQDVSQSVRPSGILQQESTYITSATPDSRVGKNFFSDLHPTQVTWSRQNGLTTYKVTEYLYNKSRFIPKVIISSVQGNYSNAGISFGFVKKFQKIYTISRDVGSTTIGELAISSATYSNPDSIYVTDARRGLQSGGSEYIGGVNSPVSPQMVLVGENTTQLGYIYEIEFTWELKFFSKDESGYSA
jgi:hypothetical protein